MFLKLSWEILPEIFTYSAKYGLKNGYALRFLGLHEVIQTSKQRNLFRNLLPISVQMMMSTCSKPLSRWTQRRMAARMWPSTPKAQWLTCFTAWKSRTMSHTSWRTLPAWNPTGAVHAPTRTQLARAWICQRTSSFSCWDYSFSWDDPWHQQQSLISSNRHFKHRLIPQHMQF